MNLSKAIASNLFISTIAVAMLFETQIQLGTEPKWQSYLLLIFFSTLFEYNLHRYISVQTKKELLKPGRKEWTPENRRIMLAWVILSGTGFLVSAFQTETKYIILLLPIALTTLFYSILVFGNYSRSKTKPYLKSLILALVWAATTTLVPALSTTNQLITTEIFILILQRFFFIFAIAVVFDIRDMEADRIVGINTIPLHYTRVKAITLAQQSLLVFFSLAFIHHYIRPNQGVLIALGISALVSYLAISTKSLRKSGVFIDATLDGTILLQALLVLVQHQITCN